MNPVLLKPQSDTGSQIIVQGKVYGTARAREYYALKENLLPWISESFEQVSASADLVLVEGAGSPAEINLRAGDVANMGFAEAADLPVILVADIDRGGVIASLVGTHAVLEPSEQARLKGYLINKFRGDVDLFESGIKAIKERTGLSSLGVIPWFSKAHLLPAEDAVAMDQGQISSHGDGNGGKPIRIAVPRLARIGNFDDLDPLRAEPDVTVEVIAAGSPLPGDADLVLLPGSKATISDLADFRANGWEIDLQAHIRRGGAVLGLCAGYQMMGHRLADPQGIEGPPGQVAGLGLLDVETVLQGPKRLVEVAGWFLPYDADIMQASAAGDIGGLEIKGYEMHMGRTQGPGCAKPLVQIDGRPDGAQSHGGRIAGCYLHGIFASDSFRKAYLDGFRTGRLSNLAYEETVEQTLNHLADHIERYSDLDRILKIARARR
jgi:adenosylcobyric acid synthase